MCEIGIGQPDVPRLIRMALNASVLTQRRRDQSDEAIEPDPGAPAQVHRFDRSFRRARRPLQPRQNAVQRVGNIGIVALARPVAVTFASM